MTRISKEQYLASLAVRSAVFTQLENPGYSIQIKIPNELWLSSNRLGGGGHPIHKKAKILRSIGERIIQNNKPIKRLPTAYGFYIVTYPTKGRADQSNAQPTIKHLLDGMTKAGLLIDDDSKHLPMDVFVRSQVSCGRGRHEVTMIFLESREQFLEVIEYWLSNS